MKKAMFWKKLKNKIVQCELCPHYCVIKNNDAGKCHVRKNIDGELISLVYAKPCSFSLDPIEKKPLYHFLPGNETISIATAGCNFSCKNCQNFEISQKGVETSTSFDLSPENAVKKTKEAKSKIISYTYTEPTIFYEYMYDISKLAKKNKMKNVLVSNGFINQKPLLKLIPLIDAANIDLKSIENDFYVKVCGARVQPVLETLKTLKKKGVWIEITNLIIPTLNDKKIQIRKLVAWIKKNLGKDVPIHFSAFYPTYQLMNLPQTSSTILRQARKIAIDLGMKYIYIGNMPDDEGNTTFCSKCKKSVIIRDGYSVSLYKIDKGKCKFCKEKIAGYW